MRSRVVIIAQVAFKNAAEMFVVDDDHMIEAFATEASDQSLHVRILPRTSWSRPYLLNSHSLNSVLEILPVNSISIANQIARRLIVGKSLDHLLCRPFCSRMFGDIEMNDSASFMRQHNEHKQHSKSSGRYREEVERDQISDVIIEKRSPRLGRGGVPFWHKPGNRTLGNLDSQLQQFAVDARCTPTHIGFRHRLHQFSDVGAGSRPTGILVPGQPGPVSFESPPLPIHHGSGLNNHQHRLPLFPDFPQTHPKQSVQWSNLRTTNAALEYPQLLAKCDILQRDLLMALKNQKHGTTNCQN